MHSAWTTILTSIPLYILVSPYIFTVVSKQIRFLSLPHTTYGLEYQIGGNYYIPFGVSPFHVSIGASNNLGSSTSETRPYASTATGYLCKLRVYIELYSYMKKVAGIAGKRQNHMEIFQSKIS